MISLCKERKKATETGLASGGPGENVRLGGLWHSGSARSSPSVTDAAEEEEGGEEEDRQQSSSLCVCTGPAEEKRKDHPSARRRGNLGGGCGRLPWQQRNETGK